MKLKPISKDAVPGALEKARQYRHLSEPWQAESICRDILHVAPGHQKAIYMLILAITDQFQSYSGTPAGEALKLADELSDDYEAEYCRGLIRERKAIATYRRQNPGCRYVAHSHFMRAMTHFSNADELRKDPANNEPILRWNACVRFIEQHRLEPSPDDEWVEPFLDV